MGKADPPPQRLSLLNILGPGLTAGASDDDPSGIATYSQAGAQFGYSLGWTLLFTFPLMAAIQESRRGADHGGDDADRHARESHGSFHSFPAALLDGLARYRRNGAGSAGDGG